MIPGMRMCDKHWQALRQAIVKRGMGHLIAGNGREAADRLIADLTGHDPDDFEPLMAAFYMIAARTVELVGIQPFMRDEESVCPICLVMATHPANCPRGCTAETIEENWIEAPADRALDYAEENHLLETLTTRDTSRY